MGYIKQRFAAKAIPMAAEIREFLKQNENTELGTYTIGQVYGGMKSIKALVTETSLLDPEEGIRFRGYTIPELREKLPHLESCTEPLPEGLFHLLLLDEIPNFRMRSTLPMCGRAAPLCRCMCLKPLTACRATCTR